MPVLDRALSAIGTPLLRHSTEATQESDWCFMHSGDPVAYNPCFSERLLHEMKRRDARKGLATLCIGGGMGVAMCVER